MIESLPGQLPLFGDEEPGHRFKLSDEATEILNEVSEMPEAAARALLLLTLTLLFSQDSAESIEAAEPAVEACGLRPELLPLRWLRRRGMCL